MKVDYLYRTEMRQNEDEVVGSEGCGSEDRSMTCD